MNNERVKKKRKASVKSIIGGLLLFILFMAGLFIILYPTISNIIVSRSQSRIINSYDHSIDTLNNEEILNELTRAHIYNESLNTGSIQDAFVTKEENVSEEYYSILNVGDGLMGYIEIPKINVKIPMYHGTKDEVLNKGVGHVAGSSLPVGGDHTHSLLAGHRGLPSAKLFTDIDMLEEKDMFYIKVLNETLAYEIDQITVILPDEVDDIRITEGDYVTLVTCTPYAVNTHRLLVRGKRVEYKEPEPEKIKIAVSKETKILVTSILAIDFFEFILLIRILIKRIKRQRRNKKNLGNN